MKPAIVRVFLAIVKTGPQVSDEELAERGQCSIHQARTLVGNLKRDGSIKSVGYGKTRLLYPARSDLTEEEVHEASKARQNRYRILNKRCYTDKDPVKRQCLSCRETFTADGPWLRLCGPCRKFADGAKLVA